MVLSYKNTQLFFTAKGTGNPLVLLHGFLESNKIWEPFIPELSKKRQVICIDLPGHGKSGNVDEIHTMELMADCVKEILQQLKVKNATFVGHSMGGYVSLAFLEKFPIMVTGLVLMNSTPEEDSEEKKLNRDRAIELVKKNKSAFVNMAVSNLLTAENNIEFKDALQEIKKEALTFSTKGIIAALRGMKIRTNQIYSLTQFNNNKYLIIGEKDPVLNSKGLIYLASQCGCKVFLTKNGHLSYLEDYSEIQEIMYFID